MKSTKFHCFVLMTKYIQNNGYDGLALWLLELTRKEDSYLSN